MIANGNTDAVTITTNNPTPSLGSYQFLASDTESDVSGTSPSGTFQNLSHTFSLGNWSQGGVTAYYFRVKWNHGSLNIMSGQQTSDSIAVTTSNSGASISSMAINLVVKVTP